MLESREVKDISEDMPTENKSNGLSTRDIYFSLEQADLAKNLLQAVNETRVIHIEAQSKWEAFLIGIGMCTGDEIVGGDLDNANPKKRCLTVKRDNGIIRE
tara:strand:- start:142 stop:444 length:303 start_codon:yes stop_codon:yes gene_type:complete